MKDKLPKTRSGATKPEATQHLDTDKQRALDVMADAEHTDGKQREILTRKIEELGSDSPSESGKKRG